MKPNQLYLSGLIILAAMLACALPGQTVQPLPTADPNAIGTFIAETAQASAQQTEQANLVSTPTVPATEISTPTAVVSLQGTSLQILEDRSTLFVDRKAGVQLTLPPGWMAMRLNEKEYYEAFALDVTLANPTITDRLTQIQKNNVDIFRLDAIDIRPGHTFNGIITDISVVFEEGDTRPLEEWANADKKSIVPFSGYKFLSSEYQQTANDLRVLVFEASWDWPTGGTLYYRGVFFGLPSGIVAVALQTNLDFKDTVLPDFELVVNTLSAINP